MKYKIVGPPGTGKTTKLLEFLEKELDNGTAPERIGFLTFTRAARLEALTRVRLSEKELINLRTIHSICYRELNLRKGAMITAHDLGCFGDTTGQRISGNLHNPWFEEGSSSLWAETDADRLLQLSNYGRHRGILLKEALTEANINLDYKFAVWLIKAYKSWKIYDDKLDYTDLLIAYLERGKPLEVDVMFVDEAQDLSPLQWEVVGKLGSKAQRWYMAGDDDQSIFGWAGANGLAFQELQTDQTIILDQSHRVSKAVYSVAMGIAGRITQRIPKKYNPTNSPGEYLASAYLRALDLNEKTFLLIRNHYREVDLTKILMDEGVPFIGLRSPLASPELRGTLQSWYKVVKEGEISSGSASVLVKNIAEDYLNPVSKKKIKENQPLININDIFLRTPNLSDWTFTIAEKPTWCSSKAEWVEQIAWLQRCIQSVGFWKTVKPNIEMMSIHQSKGKEAHTVILDTEVSKSTWDSMLNNPDEEHRVWYVGATRAKERLFTLFPSGIYSYQI
jgi:superfamily I DNA/RNA helicase